MGKFNWEEHNRVIDTILLKDSYSPEDEGYLKLERQICEENEFRFLRYCKIITVPSIGQVGGGLTPFKVTTHVKKILDTFSKDRLVSILKARQIWVSTTIAAYVLWYALFHEGANILLYSKGQLEARELLDKSKRVFDQLPGFLRLKTGLESREELSFPTMKSVIHALPSTETAGIGYTASIIVADEHAEHEYARQNYTHSRPTIDTNKGQFISVFTENPWDKANLATEIFEDALEGKNGFTPLFFPYTVIEGRDENWYEDVKRTIPDSALGGLTPELYMFKNYPRSIEEALSTPQTVSAFDREVLRAMEEDANKQSKIFKDFDLRINIYRDYHAGEFYIAASDVSLGVGKDYQATVIMNVRTGVVVADILDNHTNEEEFTLLSMEMLKLYNNPKWWIEFNLYGRRVIDIAKSSGYRNLGYRDSKREKPGFVTDERTRADLFSGLVSAINNYQITMYNSEGVRQLSSMIRNANKNGRIEARSGGHDDYSIAVGLCWLKKKEVNINFSSEPLRTLDFGKREHPAIIEKILARR